MTLSNSGAALIAEFEGFSAKPYKDPASGGEPITIGYGSTYYPSGKKVTMQDQPVTKEQALSYLKDHVDHKISGWLTANVPGISQAQFDALCSFIYNLGLGNFQQSSLLRDIKAGKDCTTITADFMKWNRASGKVMDGLTKRRQKEALLYCTGSYGSI